MLTLRRFRDGDEPVLWALNALPNIGATANPSVPLPLPPAAGPPAGLPDLADVRGGFLDAGGDFLVAELDGHLVAMGGIRPGTGGRAEVLRIRVHPATRRRGIGRALMTALERRAAELGLRGTYLDTATNQPEAMAFYRGLGYREVGRERRPEWSWTLVYYVKDTPGRAPAPGIR
ncbi:GNAT family N-acetyltransferase [Rugosimonospora acidiphila]|uniref:GNAT family N-acetyltransferase n=1 Tax=Rugosimonospora acidiphila TaxID=556531 RepID=A0ABP9SR00_9ACTN